MQPAPLDGIPTGTQSLSVMRTILMHMFGCPPGLIGRLGGHIMTRTNAACGAWVTQVLAIGPNDSVLEVGFGPGVIVQRLAELMPRGHVAGIDASREMLSQARARNAAAIKSGQVDLRYGRAESLPFDSRTFDKAPAINSMQAWSDPAAGLQEMYRVMKPAASIGLGFTAYSGQPKKGLLEILAAAGFTNANVLEKDKWFCALATKP